MAEKEERILILTGNKDNYPAWNYNHGPLYLDEDYYDGISRTEAIERMAKAMCSSDGESCKQCAVKNNKHACKSVLHDELFMQYAKSALNALLSK